MKKNFLALLVLILTTLPAFGAYWQTIIDAKTAEGSFIYKIDKTSIKAKTVKGQKIVYFTISVDITNNEGTVKAINSYESNCITYDTTMLKTTYDAKNNKFEKAKGSTNINKVITGKELEDLKGTIEAVCNNKI